MTERNSFRDHSVRDERMRAEMFCRRFVAAVAFLFVALASLHGQGVTGRIQGTVHDPSNANVAGAGSQADIGVYGGASCTAQSGSFGVIAGTARPPRQLQLGLHLAF